MEILNEKDPQEIADRLYELAKDIDFSDYEEQEEETKAGLINCIYDLKAIAQNKYNSDYYRIFYNILQRI